MTSAWPWLALVGLGIYHGLNPGMGWLFAVALGMQEKSARAVWRALPPLAAGHALAALGALAGAALLGAALPVRVVKWLVAAALAAFALQRLVSGRHPRYGGMRVGRRELVTWSCLMASAHGAGLMLVPFVLADPGADAGSHAAHAAAGLAMTEPGAFAALAHTAGYLAVTGLAAVLVYQYAGIGLIRRAWVNFDRVWAVALLGSAVVTVL